MKKLKPLSLPATVGLATVYFLLVLPAGQWLVWIHTKSEPVPPAATWLRYVAVLVVAAGVWGVALHRTFRLPPGWKRCYLAGMLCANHTWLQIDTFVQWPLGLFLVGCVLYTLVVGVVVGGIFYGMEIFVRWWWAE